MGRHRYRFTLKRRKGACNNGTVPRDLPQSTQDSFTSADSKENELDHSTPVKKHCSDSWGIPLSPIKENGDDTLNSISCSSENNQTCSDHEISGLTLCDKCGKHEAASKSTSCIHNFSSDALCEKCGNECLRSGTHTVRGSRESQPDHGDVDNLSTLCEAAHAKLMEMGRGDFLEKLLEIIVSGRLDLEGLTFQIMSDTINALSVESLTQMRFSWQSKCFWKLLLTKCGGMALRLLSGWKSIGSILTEECQRGFLDTEKSDIILAVPDEEILKKFDPYDGEWPQKLLPGFSCKIAAKVANSTSVQESSVCLSLDGKKITPGLKGEKGDIDLLGMEEDGITLRKRREIHAEEQEFISKTCQLLKEFQTTSQESELVQSLQWNMTLLSEKSIKLTEELDKKNYALDRLKKLGGEDNKNSRYCFVIQLVIAAQVELKECLETGRSLRNKLLKILAALHRKQSLILESPVYLSHLPTFYALHDIDSLLNSGNERKEELAAFLLHKGTQYVKQRSKPWFSFRREVKVTGSTIFASVGADGLKAQREHFLQKMRGKEVPEFTQEVQDAIGHGEKHEPDALATFCTRFIPSFLPDCAIYEVGCFQVMAGSVPVLVSPDGIVTNVQTGKVEAVLEIKCPYTARLHTGIPARCYLQVQAEMVALDVETCYFVSYKSDETRIFRVSKDLDTWRLAVACIEEVYGSAKDKVPTKLSETSKLLTLKIKKAVSYNCKLLAQVSSVSALESKEMGSNYDTFTTHVLADPQVSIPPGIHEHFDMKLALSTMETVSANSEKIYQLLRKKATEVVTLVASDTDRIWTRSQVIGAPICYFLKGYSLSMTVMQSILEDTLEKLHKIGMHVPCVSFDGQFMKLLREDLFGKPQTLLQLQKQHWHKVTKMQKTAIIAEFRDEEIIRQNKNTPPKTCMAYFTRGESMKPVHEQNVSPEAYQEDNICLDDVHLHTAGEHLEAEHFGTEVDDHDQDQQQYNRAESDAEKSIQITHQHYVDLLVDLSNEFDSWKGKTVDEIKVVLTQCDKLSKLKIPELKVVARFLKYQMDMDIVLSGTKFNLLCRLKKLLSLEGTIVAQNRKKTIPSLTALSVQVLQSNMYPKAALNISYAQWTFQRVKEEWQKNSKIQHDMVIPEVDATRRFDWFYVPEYSQTRKQLEVKKIDTHHLLTRHRSALCKGNLGKSLRAHFIEVANSGKTALKPGMMEQQLNMQSSDYARITFSQGVQMELEERGYQDSANLCKYVREWFESCDEPGISAVERCQMKLQYRDYLLSLVDFSSFPPPGSHIMGYSTSLWESTVAAIDTDFIMYALTRRRTYNNRALGSQPCESLYSCLATMPGAKNGVPSCVDLEVNMAKICGECIVRHDPNRGFSARLSSAPVYPQQLLERDVGPLPPPQDPPAFIHQIRIQNHLFDSWERRRLARKEPKGLTAPHEPGRGAVGVRHYHKVNECKLNPLIRAGISVSSPNHAAY